MYKDLVQSRNPSGALEAGTPSLRTADALVTLTDFFAELVLCYRLWTIWDNNYYIIIIPLLISFAFVSCAMATIGILVSTPSAAIVPKSLVPLGTSAFAIPLCFNFIVTGLIIGRIWWKGRSSHGNIGRAGGVVMLPPTYLKAATVVVIESGLVYLVVQFVLTVLFAINHPAQIMLADIATQIYGIAPTMIFVRVGLGDSTRANLSSVPSERLRGIRMPRSPGRSTGQGSLSNNLSPMSVSIPFTKTVNVHRDGSEMKAGGDDWDQTYGMHRVARELSV
ncbi:hypothetical protein PUNSTDRAFT_131262 [Punctularia strigosozonata HHB-11173 SS5]|uniref:uncharacterized protein n=1 Tax=Punctularia strigosozonata (strain HHB-11173) TaxID=741275 RepID=UPI000441817C|nr:uncharacterized protein PUNSTDRAFT_131262 [Punctularia strigosozonata HHB-11173 SS5]EIN13037.1 hypothetical protein PUNSTDRAFT_131262 [Punctularia strigosozonata HHB-11173 SS5]